MITQWLAEHSFGLIKDEKQAERFLLGAVAIIFVFSIMFFLFGRPKPNLEQPKDGYQGRELSDDFR